MRYRKTTSGLLGLACAALAAGCGGSGGDGDSYDVAFISALRGVDFTTSQDCGAKAAAKKLGVNLEVQDPAQFDPAEQTQLVEAASARNPDAIAIFPVDNKAMVPSLRAAKDAGAKIVLADNVLEDDSIAESAILGDNLAGGKLAGEAMADMLDGHGTVLVVGQTAGAPVTGDREQGFIEAAEAGGLTVLPIQYAGTAGPAKATSITQATLAKHPDLAGVFTSNLSGLDGIPVALSQAGKLGEVKFISYDAFTQSVKALRDGKVQALIAQQPYQEGYMAIERAVASLKGEQVEEKTILPNVLVTPENVDDPDIAKVLYKSHC